MLRAGYGNKKLFLILPHPLRNFEIQKYDKNEPRFNGVYSRDKLPKKLHKTYVINLDEYADVGTHWVVSHVKNIEVIYFYSFEVENVPKEIGKFIENKNIKTYSEYKQTAQQYVDAFV